MKVLVVNSMTPFIRGDIEELADHLVANLNRVAGVSAELMRVPFSWTPHHRVVDEITLCRMLEIDNVDRVIALKFPAYLIPHHDKTLWLVHQYWQVHDLYDAGHSHLPDTAEGDDVRHLIANADADCFRDARAIFVNSRTTRDRLKHHNGYDSEILAPPLNDPEYFENTGQGDYIFAGGPVNAGRRQHLLIEALKCCKSDVRLVIAGAPDTPEDADRIRRAACDPTLTGRLIVDLKYLKRTQAAEYVNSALACAYLPTVEDSAGYATLEAFQAEKPVITFTDSGGVLDIVRNGENGFVVDAEVQLLSEAMDRMFLDRKRARNMGAAGGHLLSELRLNWPATVERLLS